MLFEKPNFPDGVAISNPFLILTSFFVCANVKSFHSFLWDKIYADENLTLKKYLETTPTCMYIPLGTNKRNFSPWAGIPHINSGETGSDRNEIIWPKLKHKTENCVCNIIKRGKPAGKILMSTNFEH